MSDCCHATRWTRCAAFVAGLLLAPAMAWARAGGGEGFGGGSSGDDGLLEFVLWILFELCFDYPKFGIPFLLFLAVLIFIACLQTKSGYVTHTIRRGARLQAASARQAALAAIRSRDPQFDEQKLLARVTQAFLRIQAAWSRQDLAPARPFISDGLHERFTCQFRMQQALGYRNQLDNAQVARASTAAVVAGEQFDTIHVELRARADDYRVDLKTGQRIGSPVVPAEFVEYWSFHRRRGAQTAVRESSLEGHCPHCGAPLEIVDKARCSSCQSVVNSGAHDWVLAEITQAQEWCAPEDEPGVPGLADLKASDPAFSVQHIEDRASVMFWRIRAAEFFGDPKQAAPIASAGYLDAYSKQFGTGSERRFFNDPAVGTVELVDTAGDDAAGVDRLQILIRWSGTQSEGDPCGSHREVAGKRILTQVYRLVRKSGVQSQADATFSSASCPGCGAPIAVSAEVACSYCGAQLNDGRFDWVLDGVADGPPWRAATRAAGRPELAARPAGGAPKTAASRRATTELSLAVLARVAAADGQIDSAERKALTELGKRRGLQFAEVDAALAAGATGEVEVPVPADSREAIGFLRQMVDASLADGNVCAREKQLLLRFAQRMNLSGADVRHEIARQRKEKYLAAKRLLRNAKCT